MVGKSYLCAVAIGLLTATGAGDAALAQKPGGRSENLSPRQPRQYVNTRRSDNLDGCADDGGIQRIGSI